MPHLDLQDKLILICCLTWVIVVILLYYVFGRKDKWPDMDKLPKRTHWMPPPGSTEIQVHEFYEINEIMKREDQE